MPKNILKIVGAVCGVSAIAAFAYALGFARGDFKRKRAEDKDRRERVRTALDDMFEKYEETDPLGDKIIVKRCPATGSYECRKVFADKSSPSKEIFMTPDDEADFLLYLCSNIANPQLTKGAYTGTITLKDGTHVQVEPMSLLGIIKGV